MPMPDEDRPVHIIGAGPGGLATAAALHRRGVRAVVLERSDNVGASWRTHYDCLRLHTTRRWSALPGLAVPRAYGRWVGRADVVRYLERYADHHRLELATGVEVSRVERAGDDEGAGRWVLRANGGRVLRAPAVVVATGRNHTPYLPDWEGRDAFTGELLHAAHYRNPTPYAGKDVLVVGAGNSGAEIAVDLHRGGAGRVRLAVRTPPHLVRRSTLGFPAQAAGVLVRRLPAPVGDRLMGAAARLLLPDLGEYGLPRPETGFLTRARAGAVPVLDTGLVKAVRQRDVHPVAAVRSFHGGTVLLVDGTELTPDVVVAATGYRQGLDELVGHLDVLDPAGRPVVHGRRTAPGAPGMYFTGYTTPVSGVLREVAREADRIARAIAR